MKYIWFNIQFFLLLICSGTFLFGQAPTVQIRFEEHQFKLKEVQDKTEIAALSDVADVKLFYEHFQPGDYQKYRSYYLEGDCRATEEDFKNWSAFMQGQEVEIVSRYILESNKYTLSIIQYKMSKDGTSIYGPFTLQKFNGGWYLLNTEQSMRLMEVKGFFTHINHEFLKVVNDPTLLSQHPTYQQYVSTGGIIDGKKLFDAYPARYDADHIAFTQANTLFHGVSEVDTQTTVKLLGDFQYLADQYRISAKTKSMIDRMVTEGNYSLALETILQESEAEHIIEVTQKLNQIMTEPR